MRTAENPQSLTLLIFLLASSLLGNPSFGFTPQVTKVEEATRQFGTIVYDLFARRLD